MLINLIKFLNVNKFLLIYVFKVIFRNLTENFIFEFFTIVAPSARSNFRSDSEAFVRNFLKFWAFNNFMFESFQCRLLSSVKNTMITRKRERESKNIKMRNNLKIPNTNFNESILQISILTIKNNIFFFYYFSTHNFSFIFILNSFAISSLSFLFLCICWEKRTQNKKREEKKNFEAIFVILFIKVKWFLFCDSTEASTNNVKTK